MLQRSEFASPLSPGKLSEGNFTWKLLVNRSAALLNGLKGNNNPGPRRPVIRACVLRRAEIVAKILERVQAIQDPRAAVLM